MTNGWMWIIGIMLIGGFILQMTPLMFYLYAVFGVHLSILLISYLILRRTGHRSAGEYALHAGAYGDQYHDGSWDHELPYVLGSGCGSFRVVSLRGRQKKLGARDWMAGGLGYSKGNEKSFDLRRERLWQKITKTGDLLTKSSGIVHLS